MDKIKPDWREACDRLRDWWQDKPTDRDGVYLEHEGNCALRQAAGEPSRPTPGTVALVAMAVGSSPQVRTKGSFRSWPSNDSRTMVSAEAATAKRSNVTPEMFSHFIRGSSQAGRTRTGCSVAELGW